jgi:adenylate kinase family enzyme
MKKVIVVGNSGSGKTWLGKRIATILKIPHISLDGIIWEPGGYNMKRSELVIEAEIKRIQDSKRWVVEGVFGHLIDHFVSFADTLIYLDQPWEECKKNLLTRGSESSKQLCNETAEKNYQALIEWASKYDTRDSKASKNYHCSLFECFSGKTYRIYSRDDTYQVLKKC